MNDNALIKRIKRRITARPHTFFVIVSPGLEAVCLKEIKAILPDTEPEIRDGGIEFTGMVRDCYTANLHLRTASRILMRIGDFKATGFAELEKKLDSIEWELYLQTRQPVSLSVTAKKSRLIHTEAISERVEKSIRSKTGEPSKNQAETGIFIRVLDDRFYLSVDSSGDLLYKRGLKTGGGKAPVRETIAAGALMIAGYDGSVPLLDPMCGSGTFSLEAAMIAEKIPPGRFRTFAFETWPCFREGTWRDVLRNAETLQPENNPTPILASDIDAETCQNFENTVERTGFTNRISIDCNDFFTMKPPISEPGLIIINPPYGLRLGKDTDNTKIFDRLITRFLSEYPGWKLAILSPFTPSKKSSVKFQKYPVFHGGLKLFLVVVKNLKTDSCQDSFH